MMAGLRMGATKISPLISGRVYVGMIAALFVKLKLSNVQAC
jgi:hypothetical protein